MRLLAVTLLLALSAPVMADETLQVHSIAFKGLHNLDGRALIRGAVVKKGDRLLVSSRVLEENLKGNPLVEDFSFQEKQGQMVVTVREKVIIMRAIIPGKSGTLIFEVDKNYQAVSRNTLLARDPVTVQVPGEQKGDQYLLMGQLKRMFSVLLSIYKENGRLYSQLRFITVMPDGTLNVILRGRSVHYRLDGSLESFRKLAATAGYLDRESFSAGKVVIDRTATVVFK